MCLFAAAGLGAAAGGMSGLQIGMSVLGQVVGFMGQMQQYNAQMQQAQEQARRAQETLNQQVAQQQGAYVSQVNKAQQEKFAVTKASMVASSKATAAAAESGIAGISVDNLLGEIDMNTSEFTAQVDVNSEMAHRNAMNELKMAERGARARVAEIPIPTKPNFGSLLVGIGTSVVKGMDKGYKLTPGVDTFPKVVS